MKQQYIPPVAVCLCFIAAEQVAAVAPIDLLNGSTGPGSAAIVSTTDIRVDVNP